MMQAVLVDMERAEERVLNFNRSNQGPSGVESEQCTGHLTLMDDYFSLDALFMDIFLSVLLDETKIPSIAYTMVSDPTMTISS